MNATGADSAPPHRLKIAETRVGRTDLVEDGHGQVRPREPGAQPTSGAAPSGRVGD
jgi:hypothetical protein